MTGTTDGLGARAVASPVQMGERIVSLDVLRGFAILGILAGVVVGNFKNHGVKSRIRATRASRKYYNFSVGKS